MAVWARSAVRVVWPKATWMVREGGTRRGMTRFPWCASYTPGGTTTGTTAFPCASATTGPNVCEPMSTLIRPRGRVLTTASPSAPAGIADGDHHAGLVRCGRNTHAEASVLRHCRRGAIHEDFRSGRRGPFDFRAQPLALLRSGGIGHLEQQPGGNRLCSGRRLSRDGDGLRAGPDLDGLAVGAQVD